MRTNLNGCASIYYDSGSIDTVGEHPSHFETVAVFSTEKANWGIDSEGRYKSSYFKYRIQTKEGVKMSTGAIPGFVKPKEQVSYFGSNHP